MFELADKDADQLIINFTKFGDEELVSMKKLAEQEMSDNYMKKHQLDELTLKNVSRYLYHMAIPANCRKRLKLRKRLKWIQKL